jgi:NAD+ synthase (glutamine-hydrolysing)
MRIGLAQLNATVGDIPANSARILAAYRRLVAQGAELVVTPELALCGYPPRDLLFKRRFVPDLEAAASELAKEVGTVPLLLGTVVPAPGDTGRPFSNAAAWCHEGSIVAYARKCLLPTYDVFDEDRYFEPATQPAIFIHNNVRIGVTICEDIWTRPVQGARKLHKLNPVTNLATRGVELMINLSASPWHHGKGPLREALLGSTARSLAAPAVYCNAIGANDELIFDGASLAVDADGQILARLPAFQEAEVVIDTARRAVALPPAAEDADLRDMHAALVLGVRDYAHKSGFHRVLIALSGGIDSALVAEIAVAALGPTNVIGISLPSAVSSDHSREDARRLAENLGTRFETIGIAECVTTAEQALAPLFLGTARDVTEENLQARLRGVVMMALSNKFGGLLLTTGNKSEVAVGYCTLYGDMCGGLAVIADVFKTEVYALCRWINRDHEIIPRRTIEKPPSAELRPDQTDQDSLPPYETLDALLQGYIEEGLGRVDLIEKGFPEAIVHDVCRKVDINEYKRKQAAPGLKLTPLAFGIGRRMPIVQHYLH